MEILWTTVSGYLNKLSQLPVRIKGTDIIEIILISFLIYHIMVWIRSTRAWGLVKGIAVLLLFTLLAMIFHLSTIIWLAEKTLGIGITAVIIVFQPELRKALEQLGSKASGIRQGGTEKSKKGNKGLLSGFFSKEEERFSDRTIAEIVEATFRLAQTKTGALIVMEKDVLLIDWLKTGIELDAIVSSGLLINIFEHNTPLHDGAVIIRGDRILAATCYLPLSDNMKISKELGTRHRAGLGASESTDVLVIIVSEETGKVSATYGGTLERNLTMDRLKELLLELQKKEKEKEKEEKKGKWKFGKGRETDEEKIDE